MFKVRIEDDPDGVKMLQDAATNAGARLSGAYVPDADVLRVAANHLLQRAAEMDAPGNRTLLLPGASLDFTLVINP